MAENENFGLKISNLSPFWLITIVLALGSFVFLAIKGIQDDNLLLITIVSVMFTIIISGLIFSGFKIDEKATWGSNTLSLTLGFLIWTLWLNLSSLGAQQSTVALTQNHLLATISGELPLIQQVVTNALLIPIAEEVFWMIGLPYTIARIMGYFSKNIPLFGKSWFQILVIVLVSSTSFAFFHVGNASLIAFIIVAMFFRTFLIVSVYAEKSFNYIKWIGLTTTFGLGAHFANNIFTYGYANTIAALQQEPVVMIITLLYFAIIFASGIKFLYKKISNTNRKIASS